MFHSFQEDQLVLEIKRATGISLYRKITQKQQVTYVNLTTETDIRLSTTMHIPKLAADTNQQRTKDINY